MKIRVGDRVKFLNDIGSGEVTRIIDQKTALVSTDEGFEVPHLIRDLVVALGSYESDEEEELQDPAPPVRFAEQVNDENEQDVIEDEELVFAFLADRSSSEFSCYLINSSSYYIKYTISRQQEGEQVLFHEGDLEAGTKIDLGSYLPGNLNEDEYFRVQALFYNKGFFFHMAPLDLLLKISASELYDASRHSSNDYFHEKAMIYTLYDWKKKPEPRIEIDPEELKKAMLTKGDLKPEKAKKENKGIEEVDLHIENLVDRHSGMENSEILDIQISRFRTALESAIIHKNGRMVFIHGVGNGKLKHEIRKILDTEYKKLRYQDASFKEYGYGATMVLLK